MANDSWPLQVLSLNSRSSLEHLKVSCTSSRNRSERGHRHMYNLLSIVVTIYRIDNNGNRMESSIDFNARLRPQLLGQCLLSRSLVTLSSDTPALKVEVAWDTHRCVHCHTRQRTTASFNSITRTNVSSFDLWRTKWVSFNVLQSSQQMQSKVASIVCKRTSLDSAGQ